MDPVTLKATIAAHGLWLRGIADGKKADLSGANLYRANLYRANLSGANLSGADLSEASLSGAYLSRANLSWADLSGANLYRANLYRANLSGANLYRANLSGRKPLLADIERNYVLYVLPEVEDGPRFIAGCRNFTRDEAIEHWGEVRPQPSYVAAINAYVANAE